MVKVRVEVIGSGHTVEVRFSRVPCVGEYVDFGAGYYRVKFIGHNANADEDGAVEAYVKVEE